MTGKKKVHNRNNSSCQRPGEADVQLSEGAADVDGDCLLCAGLELCQCRLELFVRTGVRPEGCEQTRGQEEENYFYCENIQIFSSLHVGDWRETEHWEMWPSDCLPATSGHLTATIRKTWQQPTTQNFIRKKTESLYILNNSVFLSWSLLVFWMRRDWWEFLWIWLLMRCPVIPISRKHKNAE